MALPRCMGSFKMFIAFFISCLMLYIVVYPDTNNLMSSSRSTLPTIKNKKFLAAVKEWKQCFTDGVEKSRQKPIEMWDAAHITINVCRNKTAISRINVTAVRNKDETKYHVYSTSKEPSVVVTLGVGLDVVAEQTLKANLPSASRFYGADPIYQGNGELFEPVGTYFPFAVGKEIAVTNALVLKNTMYKSAVMPHIDIITFLTKFVNESTIDQFLMDNEGPEYDIIPMMARGAEFDKAGLVVCQCNAEVHTPDPERKKKFMDIVNTFLADGRYVWMTSSPNIHHRLSFINVENPFCVDKYFSRFFE